MREFGFFLSWKGVSPIHMVTKKQKNVNTISEWNHNWKFTNLLSGLVLSFAWDIPHMNSEMDRPSFHHNNS